MRNKLKILSCLLTVLVAIGFDFTSKQKARAEAVVCGDLYVDEHHEPLTFTVDQVSVCIYDSKWMEA